MNQPGIFLPACFLKPQVQKKAIDRRYVQHITYIQHILLVQTPTWLLCDATCSFRPLISPSINSASACCLSTCSARSASVFSRSHTCRFVLSDACSAASSWRCSCLCSCCCLSSCSCNDCFAELAPAPGSQTVQQYNRVSVALQGSTSAAGASHWPPVRGLDFKVPL